MLSKRVTWVHILVSKNRGIRVGNELTRANDIQHIKVMPDDKTIEMSMNKRETRAGAPMTKKTVFDVLGFDLAFKKNVIAQENHR
jgi:hypothetical protein